MLRLFFGGFFSFLPLFPSTPHIMACLADRMEGRGMLFVLAPSP